MELPPLIQTLKCLVHHHPLMQIIPLMYAERGLNLHLHCFASREEGDDSRAAFQQTLGHPDVYNESTATHRIRRGSNESSQNFMSNHSIFDHLHYQESLDYQERKKNSIADRLCQVVSCGLTLEICSTLASRPARYSVQQGTPNSIQERKELSAKVHAWLPNSIWEVTRDNQVHRIVMRH